ncbi:MAG: hypothetical protein IPG39_18980 [Bacteroidetes bacterium]|nr:hypothetical protein [Bacteroidota bacterium]
MRKLLFLMAALPFISNSVKAQNETIRISSDTILVINNGLTLLIFLIWEIRIRM